MLLPLIGEITFFVGFLTYALLARGKDRETHKRMMILATVAIMPGALDRMGWLPGHGIPSAAMPCTSTNCSCWFRR